MYAPANQYIPQIGTNRWPLLMWLLVASVSLAAMGTIVGAPVALSSGHDGLAGIIYQTFSHLCHQLPERSFFVDGHPFAVCARCTGIYAGFAAAAVFYPLVRSLRQIDAPARKWLFIAAAPLGLDFSIEFTGLWHNTHTSRLLTGALLGAVSVFYVMPGLLDLSLRQWKRGNEGLADNRITPPEEIQLPEMVSSPTSLRSDYSAPHRRI